MGIYSSSTRSVMRRSAIVASLLASAVTFPAFGQTVTNPGFETGNTNGWTLNGGIWSSGWPPPQSQYSGPATIATVVSAGGTDAITGAPVVFNGNYALKLNNSGGGNDINAASQIVNGYNAAKLYYAWNAVLEPSHGATDSPSFVIKVTDLTSNTVLTNIAYSAYTAQNATGLFRDVNGWVTSDWKVEDIDTIAGHDIKMEFVAIDCLYGGHGGYVYLDGFGNVVPTANAGVSFNPATGVVKGATLLLPIGGSIPDIDTAQPFYTTTALAGGLVNPVFVGGTLRADTANAVTNAFTVQSAGGTIDTNGFNVLFSGAFTGAGGLTKIGLGTATLAAVNTINGSVAINAGALNVSGTLSALDVQVNSGGTLMGRGNVIAPIFVNSGGTLSPGDAIGTMSVTDRVTMRAGSTLAIDIDGRVYNSAGGSGTYDRVVVAGTAGTFIAGGTIAPRLRGITAPATNAFTPVLGDRFTVITAASNSGQFAVAQPASGLAANMRFDVLYNPTNIQLVVTPNNFAVLGAASNWKLNAVRTGAGLDAVRPAAGTRAGTLQSLFNGLYGMDAAGYGYAFQQLSGEVHTNTMSVIGNTVQGMNNLALSAAATNFGGEVCAEDGDRKRRSDGDCMDRRFRPAVWTQLLYQQTQVQDDAVAYDFSNDQKGFIAGVHVVNQPETRIGIGGRYTENDLQSNLHNSAEADGWGLFAYASHDLGPVRLSATGGWSKAKVKTKRDLTLLTGTTTSTAAYDMTAFNAAAEARVNVPIGKGVIQPLVGITHESVSADAVNELNTDPNLALKLAKTKWDVTRSKVGADLSVPMGGPLTFTATGAWRHTISGDATASRVATLGPASWVVSSPISDNDTYEFGAGIAAKLGARTTLRLDYTGFRDGGSYKADRAMLGLSHAF